MAQNESKSVDVASPYTTLIQKILKLDERKPNAVFRRRLLDWANTSDKETVVSAVDAALAKVHGGKIIRALVGLDGPAISIAALAKMYALDEGRIRQIFSIRDIRRHILESLPKPVPPKKILPELPPPTPEQQAYLATGVEYMGLSMQAAKSLQKSGIMTIGDAMSRSPEELLEVMFFGRKALRHVEWSLALRGLRLRDTEMAMLPWAMPTSKARNEFLVSSIHRWFDEWTLQALRKRGILTFGDLVRRSAKELRAIKGFSSWSLNEVTRYLMREHLHLRDTEE